MGNVQKKSTSQLSRKSCHTTSSYKPQFGRNKTKVDWQPMRANKRKQNMAKSSRTYQWNFVIKDTSLYAKNIRIVYKQVETGVVFYSDNNKPFISCRWLHIPCIVVRPFTPPQQKPGSCDNSACNGITSLYTYRLFTYFLPWVSWASSNYQRYRPWNNLFKSRLYKCFNVRCVLLWHGNEKFVMNLQYDTCI